MGCGCNNFNGKYQNASGEACTGPNCGSKRTAGVPVVPGFPTGYRTAGPGTPILPNIKKGSVQVPGNRPLPPNMVVTGTVPSSRRGPIGVIRIGYIAQPRPTYYAAAGRNTAPWEPTELTTQRTARPPGREVWRTAGPSGTGGNPGPTFPSPTIGTMVITAGTPGLKGSMTAYGTPQTAPSNMMVTGSRRSAEGPIIVGYPHTYRGFNAGGPLSYMTPPFKVIKPGTPGVEGSMTAHGTPQTAPSNMMVTGSRRSAEGPIIWGMPAEFRSRGGGGKDQYTNLPKRKFSNAAGPFTQGSVGWGRTAGPFTQGTMGWGRPQAGRTAGPFTQGSVGWGRTTQGVPVVPGFPTGYRTAGPGGHMDFKVIKPGRVGEVGSMEVLGTPQTAPSNMIVTGSRRSKSGPMIIGMPVQWRSGAPKGPSTRNLQIRGRYKGLDG